MIAGAVLAMNAGFIDMVCLHSASDADQPHDRHHDADVERDLRGRRARVDHGRHPPLVRRRQRAVRHPHRRRPPDAGSPYGVGLGAEAALLGVASAHAGPTAGPAASTSPPRPAAARTRSATSHCGMTLRTTHMTGILTDLGILARPLAARPPARGPQARAAVPAVHRFRRRRRARRAGRRRVGGAGPVGRVRAFRPRRPSSTASGTRAARGRCPGSGRRQLRARGLGHALPAMSIGATLLLRRLTPGFLA